MNRKSIVLVSIIVLGLLIGIILFVGIRSCNINTAETVSSNTNVSVFSSSDSSKEMIQSSDIGSDYTEFYTSSADTSGESSHVTTSSSVFVTESNSSPKEGKETSKKQTPTPKATDKTTTVETSYTQSSWELPGI